MGCPFKKLSMSEKVKIFKWHSIFTEFKSNAHTLVACILNDFNMCQQLPYNSILKRHLRDLFLKYLVSCKKILFLMNNSILK